MNDHQTQKTTAELALGDIVSMPAALNMRGIEAKVTAIAEHAFTGRTKSKETHRVVLAVTAFTDPSLRPIPEGSVAWYVDQDEERHMLVALDDNWNVISTNEVRN